MQSSTIPCKTDPYSKYHVKQTLLEHLAITKNKLQEVDKWNRLSEEIKQTSEGDRQIRNSKSTEDGFKEYQLNC
jgi:hypothetical protein